MLSLLCAIKGQFAASYNSVYSQNISPDTFIRNVFIGIRKSDSTKVFL